MIIFRSFKPIVLSRNLQLSYKPTYSQLFTTQHLKMPLIVPGINSGGANSKTDEWMNKLVGKKLGDGSSDATTFAKTDLPKEARVIQPGQMVTKDFNPERLNVHVDDSGTVTHVDHQ